MKYAKWSDPDINPTYTAWAQHYQTTIIPARKRKYRDKAKVEAHVLHLQRYILARIRNITFFSIEEINKMIRQLVEQFNQEPLQKSGKTRKELFETLDRPNVPNAKPLPETPFQVTEIKTDCSVHPDYHIQFRNNYYSVPFAYAHQKVDVILCGNIVHIYHRGETVPGTAYWMVTSMRLLLKATCLQITGLSKD